ncbi:MAG: alpha/beta fold hydrolase [Pseudomonadota bacterium]
MAENEPEQKTDTHRQLIEKIYSAAMDPAGYTNIVQAWDAHFTAVADRVTADEDGNFDWTQEFLGHFEQAGQIFDRLDLTASETLTEQVRAMQNAAVLVGTDGRAFCTNSAAKSYLGSVEGKFLIDLAYDQPSREALNVLMQSTRSPLPKGTRIRRIVRLLPEHGEVTKIFVADLARDQTDGSPVVFIRSVEDRWHDSVRPMLQKSFGLTDAEVELVKSLQLGATIKEVSRSRKRSPATLRTQLSAVLGKMGIHSQVELARIVSGLIDGLTNSAVTENRALPGATRKLAPNQRTYSIELSGGETVQIAESGDLSGLPFYLIQTTTWPTLTDQIVQSLANSGIRLISAFRSGSGETSRLPTTMTLDELSQYHLNIVSHIGLERPLIGGQCSGGIYALALAKLMKAEVSGVLLVDTGAPLQTFSMINQMPLAPRRLFLAARYFPSVLRTPYKMALKDFYSGPDGEERGVQYFVDGSPHDQGSVSDPAIWRVVRDNFDYVMRNWEQAIQDVIFWSSDTSELLSDVIESTPVTYLQGAENLLFPPRFLHDLKKQFPSIQISVVEDEAQLLIYRRPDLFSSTIHQAATQR